MAKISSAQKASTKRQLDPNKWRTFTDDSGKERTVEIGSRADVKYGGAPVTKPTEPKTEVGAISSGKAQDYLKQLQGIEKKLSGFQEQIDKQNLEQEKGYQESLKATLKEGRTPEQIAQDDATQARRYGFKPDEVPQTTATLINPETEQSQTVSGEQSVVEQQIADLQSKGYELAEGTTEGLKQEQSKEEQAALDLIDQQTAELQNYMRELENNMITDKELRGEVRAITNKWAGRIDEMRDINMRKAAYANTVGIRKGARYTGGKGGLWGDIVSEEERQGVLRISQLQAERDAEIIKAKKEARDFNYTTYATLIEKAQGISDQKIKALSDLRAAQQKQEQKIEEDKKLVKYQQRIIDAFESGSETSYDILKATNGEVPYDVIKQVSEDMDIAVEDTQFTLGETQIRYDAEGNVIARGAKVAGGPGTYTSSGGGGTGSSLANDVADLSTATEEERRIMDDIIRQLPVRLKDNVAEVPILKQSILADLRRGLSFQQISNKMAGFVLEPNADIQLGEQLLAHSAGTTLELGDLSRLINMGKPVQAMTMVENAQLETVEAELSKTDTARGLVNQADRVLGFMNDPNNKAIVDKLGQFDARVFRFDRITPLNAQEETRVQQLETMMQALNAQIRIPISGTQVTDTEFARLSALQAELTNQPHIVKAKVQELGDFTLEMHNQARSQRGLPQVTRRELKDEKARLELYKTLGQANKAAQFSNLSNTDLLQAITDPNYKPGDDTTDYSSMSNEDFWGNFGE